MYGVILNGSILLRKYFEALTHFRIIYYESRGKDERRADEEHPQDHSPVFQSARGFNTCPGARESWMGCFAECGLEKTFV